MAAGKRARWSEMSGGDGWTVLFLYSFFMVVACEGFERGKRVMKGGFARVGGSFKLAVLRF